MIVAQVVVSTGRADAEYQRVAELLKKRDERKNDLPATVEIDGDGGVKLSVPLNDIALVGLTDFVKADAEEAGVRDTFPNLFKR